LLGRLNYPFVIGLTITFVTDILIAQGSFLVFPSVKLIQPVCITSPASNTLSCYPIMKVMNRSDLKPSRKFPFFKIKAGLVPGFFIELIIQGEPG